jgi:hypothetical protein
VGKVLKWTRFPMEVTWNTKVDGAMGFITVKAFCGIEAMAAFLRAPL